jgi:hypothetical protein
MPGFTDSLIGNGCQATSVFLPTSGSSIYTHSENQLTQYYFGFGPGNKTGDRVTIKINEADLNCTSEPRSRVVIKQAQTILEDFRRLRMRM